MEKELRKSGISVVGDVPWGTHFCTFYETPQDLLDILVPYFQAGLQHQEFCLWIISNSELITSEEAKQALGRAVSDLDRDLAEGRIEIVSHDECFLKGGVFDFHQVVYGFKEKLEQALANGYAGLRINGSPAWIQTEDPNVLREFEGEADRYFADERIIASCTYPIGKSRAEFLLDVARNHQFTIARRHGIWDVLETPQLKQAKQEIQRLNEDLEQRVTQRTKKLEETTEQLKAEIEERKKREVEARRTSRALRLVSGSNVTLLRITDETSVLNEVCRLAVEVGGYKLAWIGFAEPDERKTVRPVAHAGFEGGYLESANVTWADEPHGRGPGGIVIRTGKPFVVRHIPTDPTLAPWRAEARQMGYQSSVTLPLRSERQTFGFLAIYAAEPDAFDDGEVRVLSELANDLAFGVTVLRMRTSRNQTEQALRESEERFRQLAENIREVFWLSTADLTKMLYVSGAYESVWGRTRESLYREPRSFIDAIHSEDRARVVDVIERERARGPFEVEYRVVRPDGSICWIRDRGFPIKDDGHFYRVAGIAEDITERKQAEEAVRRSEEHLRLVIDTIPVMAWSTRPDGSVDFLNERWLDYAGLSFEQYVQDPTGPVHPEDVPRIMEKWRAVMATGEPYEAEMRLRRADGEYRWFLVRTEPLRDEQGNVVKWYGSSTDIEDRKQAEEKLRHSEIQLAQAQRLAHIGSWDWDLRTNAVTWSEELYHIFGLQPGTINVAGEVDRFIHPDDLDLGWDIVKRAVASKEPYDYYHRILRPDGTERIARSHGAVVTDDHGEPIRVFGATQDVTELKHAEEKLKSTTEQLRALSARLRSAREEESKRIAREIHDELGGNLTSLRWDLEEVGDIISGAADSTHLMALRSKVEAMITVTDNTLDTVRRLASELRPIALDELGLVEAVEWQARQFESRAGIAVGYECSLDEVDLNSQQSIAIFRILQEALTNILRHAQATEVTITMKQESGELVLAIQDNGRGITESEKSAARSLGLLGMRERALLIGATLDITGTPGKGTEVVVKIPISASD